MRMPVRLAIDIGGTFTDFLLSDRQGKLHSYKTLTTPNDYTQAIAEGLQRVVAAAGLAVEDIEQVLHATTLGSNTLLERTGARTGLITTQGFRDVLEIRDLRMPRAYDMNWEKPRTLVRRRWRRVVAGRIAANGMELTALNEVHVRDAVDMMRAEGIESVAVCLINSYANPSHEIRIGQIIAERWPEARVSLSHELLPEEGEYPRTSTTVINAYVQPVIQQYVARLQEMLRSQGVPAQLFFMQSNGGLTPAQRAAAAPIHIIESGPAAGVVGASVVARAMGIENLITLDIGGTTAKAALITNGELSRANEFQVGGEVLQVERLLSGGGFTLRVPAIDLAEVGAGGGSVVSIDVAGVPQVGPRSAGASPGPVCYGRGGGELTVTDCNLTLGYLNEDSIAGGQLKLSRAAAVVATGEQLAKPLGLSTEIAAHGAFTLACMTMIQAIRSVTTERGQDPRDFAIFAFGGNGPLFAGGIATALGCSNIVVPPFPGVFSALGLLCANVEIHKTRSFRRQLGEETVAQARDVLAEAAEAAALEAGHPGGTISATARMRYIGQSSDLLVNLGDPARLTLGGMRERFIAEHDRIFKFSAPEDEPIQVTAVEVAYSIPVGEVKLDRAGPSKSPYGRAQQMYFDGWVDAAIVRRIDLDSTEGPCIVLDEDATTLLPPGFTGKLDAGGSLLLTRLAAQGRRASRQNDAEHRL